MNETKVYNYLSPAVYDTGLIEIVDNKFKLKLTDEYLDYTEDFEDDTDFTYDSDKIEFISGLMRQKDKRPANSICGATFTTNLNLNWAANGFVDLSYNANGTPVLSGGKVNCVGSNGLYYEDDLIGNLAGNFVIKVKITPHYTGAPGANYNIITSSQISGLTDVIIIYHSTLGGSIRITANGLSASSFGIWQPTAEQDYIFEIICISNQISIYIDDVQLGTAKTITPGQGSDNNRIWLGAYADVFNDCNMAYDDFILYSSASQSATYTVPEAIYLENNVIIPEMQKVGAGCFQSLNSFSTIEAGNPKYTIQIGRSGNYLYWDGDSWEISDGTYNQANDKTTFNANIGSLSVFGEIYIQIKIHFFNSNNISSISELIMNILNSQYSTTNPTIAFTEKIRSNKVLSIVENSIKPETTEIKGIHNSKYINIDTWEESNGTYAQSSLIALNNTYAEDLVSIPTDILTVIFLNSCGGFTPELTSLTIDYEFALEEPVLIENSVSSYLKDPEGNILASKIVKVKYGYLINDTVIFSDDYAEDITDSKGYWKVILKYEDIQPDKLYWDINGKKYITNFLAGNRKFSELTIESEDC